MSHAKPDGREFFGLFLAGKKVADKLVGTAKRDQCNKEKSNQDSERAESDGKKSRAKKKEEYYH